MLLAIPGIPGFLWPHLLSWCCISSGLSRKNRHIDTLPGCHPGNRWKNRETRCRYRRQRHHSPFQRNGAQRRWLKNTLPARKKNRRFFLTGIRWVRSLKFKGCPHERWVTYGFMGDQKSTFAMAASSVGIPLLKTLCGRKKKTHHDWRGVTGRDSRTHRDEACVQYRRRHVLRTANDNERQQMPLSKWRFVLVRLS